MASILIIDDEAVLRKGVVDVILSHWPDLTIYEAADGAMGIELAILQKPDLIITDGNLPLLTGFHLVLLLREMKTVAHIPLIAMTAAPENSLAVRLMIETCDAFISKPFDVSRFLSVVTPFLTE